MRVLVTGASGFIGRALRRALVDRGDEVVPVVRRPAAAGEVRVDLVARRLDWSTAPEPGPSAVDAVAHLAGAPIAGQRWSASRREEILASRVALVDLLVDDLGATGARPRAFVSMSAVGYYGDRGEEVLDESSGPGTGFLPEVCRAWERAAERGAELGSRVVCVRTGIVLGPGGGALKAEMLRFRLGLGGRLGTGRQWTSWVSLEDEVRILLAALDDDRLEGPVNAVAPSPVRQAELARAIGQALGRPSRLTLPAPLLRLALGRGPADELLLASQRVIPRRLLDTGFDFLRPHLDDALACATGAKAVPR
jgi:uncharacterized protein (TIGR01777 family)